MRVASDPEVNMSENVRQAKCLDIIEKSMMQLLLKHGRDFVEAVNRLPTGARINSAAGRRLALSEKEMVRNYHRMLTQLGKTLVDHSETYRMLICLNRLGVNADLCRCVIGFVA